MIDLEEAYRQAANRTLVNETEIITTVYSHIRMGILMRDGLMRLDVQGDDYNGMPERKKDLIQRAFGTGVIAAGNQILLDLGLIDEDKMNDLKSVIKEGAYETRWEES